MVNPSLQATNQAFVVTLGVYVRDNRTIHWVLDVHQARGSEFVLFHQQTRTREPL